MRIFLKLNRFITLQAKFLFFVIPPVVSCFLLFSILQTVLSYQERKEDIIRNLNNHATIQSAILAKSLWGVDFDLAKIQVESMSMIPGISGVKATEFTTETSIEKGFLPSISDESEYFLVEKEILYASPTGGQHIGDLIVVSEKSSIYKPLFQSLGRDTFLLLILLIAIVASAVTANRLIIGRPLELFLAAIQKADKENDRQQVDWYSQDELGTVIKAYNKLLVNLSDAEVSQKESLKDKKILGEQLQRAKSMEAVGLMAGGVAHDLNNILSGIIAYPELMLQKLPRDSDLRGPLNAIQESGTRAATVVDDLLTVAKSAASAREIHDINSLVLGYLDSPECKRLKSQYPKVTVQYNFATVQPHLFCSPVHVKKCLMNLVTNAGEAISDEGEITISTENQSVNGTMAEVNSMAQGEYLVLTILDTGHGIPEEKLVHIFEPFYTKKILGRGGTGLGLTVVWNTMENHGGKIVVTSNNRGTCFKLFFPAAKVTDETQLAEVSSEILNGHGEYILVVDDELQLRDIASQMLQGFNYKVDSVSSGEQAMEFVKKQRVDLIVLDMLMSPGMSGRQTYEKIIKLYPTQKAIIASGFSENEDVKAVLQLGVSGFVKKPYSIEQLGRAVKKAIHS